MFIQNICVAARAYGIHTCPQAAWSSVHNDIAPLINISDNLALKPAKYSNISHNIESNIIHPYSFGNIKPAVKYITICRLDQKSKPVSYNILFLFCSL